MTSQTRLLIAFETLNPQEIKAILDEGFDPNTLINGRPAVMALIEMYYRSDAFPDCLHLMIDHGAIVDDPLILPVLLNDIRLLEAALVNYPNYLDHRVQLSCAFAALEGATLLHLAAEYGHLRAASWLIEKGCDVNAPAYTDILGYNGHTPIFHTVNSNSNRSVNIMRLLLTHGARTDVILKGLWWGKGFDWETLFFDVTPISFAQMGLLPQIHRREADIYGNITELLSASGRPVSELRNVPNKYLM